ncbi:hypothetical protein QAD02_001346 [Eretmocerus hayati]|uniref:Uncharacterized protein n=1 Tax=Eretmocerus hayati TaxID=131215 RepID=A0ACC2NG68_9HYME|nr:hypothetical protein QAD02_001346 [Eretmocerus hayati]
MDSARRRKGNEAEANLATLHKYNSVCKDFLRTCVDWVLVYPLTPNTNILFLFRLDAELYYVRAGIINTYAMNFIVPVAATIDELEFTWQSLAGQPNLDDLHFSKLEYVVYGSGSSIINFLPSIRNDSEENNQEILENLGTDLGIRGIDDSGWGNKSLLRM